MFWLWPEQWNTPCSNNMCVNGCGTVSFNVSMGPVPISLLWRSEINSVGFANSKKARMCRALFVAYTPHISLPFRKPSLSLLLRSFWPLVSTLSLLHVLHSPHLLLCHSWLPDAVLSYFLGTMLPTVLLKIPLLPLLHISISPQKARASPITSDTPWASSQKEEEKCPRRWAASSKRETEERHADKRRMTPQQSIPVSTWEQ